MRWLGKRLILPLTGIPLKNTPYHAFTESRQKHIQSPLLSRLLFACGHRKPPPDTCSYLQPITSTAKAWTRIPHSGGSLCTKKNIQKNQETSQTRGQSAENLKMYLTITAPPCEKQPGIGMWLKLFRGSFATYVAVTSDSFIEAIPIPPCRKR